MELRSTVFLFFSVIPSYVWATGIMMPDLGPWGGILFAAVYFGVYGFIYIGLPALAIFILYKMAKKYRSHQNEEG